MEPSKMCFDLVKAKEGLLKPGASGFYEAYHGKADKPGVWTIGYGVTWYPNGKAVREGDKASRTDVEMWLQWHIGRFADIVDAHIPKGLNLTQGKFDALTDFCYNEGEGQLLKSTLWQKLLNNPNDQTIFTFDIKNGIPVVGSCEFMKFVYSAGKVVDALVWRRATDCLLYSTGVINLLGH